MLQISHRFFLILLLPPSSRYGEGVLIPDTFYPYCDGEDEGDDDRRRTNKKTNNADFKSRHHKSRLPRIFKRFGLHW